MKNDPEPSANENKDAKREEKRRPTPVVNDTSVLSPAFASTLSDSSCLVKSTWASSATDAPSGVKKVSKWPRKACMVPVLVAVMEKEEVKSSDLTVAVEIRMS